MDLLMHRFTPRKLLCLNALLLALIIGCTVGAIAKAANIGSPAGTLTGKTIRKNIRYSSKHAICVGDLYLLNNSQQQLHPAVVIIHGGAWRSGSKEDFNAVEAAEWLSNGGFVVYNINYRLTGDGGEFPNNITDVENAVSFLVNKAQSYEIDKNRIGVFGCSAGGHLALMAAYAPNRQNHPKSIKAVVAFCPLTDLSDLEVAFVVQYLGCVLEEQPETFAKASPITYSKSSVPTLLVHGVHDRTVPIRQSIKLARLLRENSTRVELVQLPEEDHMFSLKNCSGRVAALKDLVAFFQETL